MKALRLRSPRTFDRVDVPIPHLASNQANQIVVRGSLVSMCGSDIPFFSGGKPEITYPLAPGAHAHECVGQVVESTSALFRPGEHVAAIPDHDLGLAEFFVARESKAVRLPIELAGRQASTLIQPLSTVVYALDRLGSVQGLSIAVVGLGGIGLLFCWLLRKCGARTVVGVDPVAFRCQVAQEMGATKTLPLRANDVVQASRRNTGDWEPPQICIEAVGHQQETLNDCIDLVQQAGTVLAFGVPDQHVYAVEFETFFRKKATLVACVTPPWDRYLAIALDLFRAYRQELARLVTHRLPIKDAEEAYAAYERHDDGLIKLVMECSSW